LRTKITLVNVFCEDFKFIGHAINTYVLYIYSIESYGHSLFTDLPWFQTVRIREV